MRAKPKSQPAVHGKLCPFYKKGFRGPTIGVHRRPHVGLPRSPTRRRPRFLLLVLARKRANPVGEAAGSLFRTLPRFTDQRIRVSRTC
jgi:hypothetical protein